MSGPSSEPQVIVLNPINVDQRAGEDFIFLLNADRALIHILGLGENFTYRGRWHEDEDGISIKLTSLQHADFTDIVEDRVPPMETLHPPLQVTLRRQGEGWTETEREVPSLPKEWVLGDPINVHRAERAFQR